MKGCFVSELLLVLRLRGLCRWFGIARGGFRDGGGFVWWERRLDKNWGAGGRLTVAAWVALT